MDRVLIEKTKLKHLILILLISFVVTFLSYSYFFINVTMDNSYIVEVINLIPAGVIWSFILLMWGLVSFCICLSQLLFFYKQEKERKNVIDGDI